MFSSPGSKPAQRKRSRWEIKLLDSISSSFNGSVNTFNLTISSVAVAPPNPQSLLVVLGGVPQIPGTNYNVLGSKIQFATAPLSGDNCFINYYMF